MAETGWTVSETTFDPAHLHHKETVFTIGNGYLGTRGAFEEGYPGARPATLIHGIYDDVAVVHTELANCPDWLPLHVFVNGERFRLDRGRLLRYRRTLDLRHGVLSRQVRWCSPAGQVLDLSFERFAGLADEHLLAIRFTIFPVEQPCTVEVQAGINGCPDNMGVMHWEWIDQGETQGSAWLHTRTRHSAAELGMASRLTIAGAGSHRIEHMNCHNCPTQVTRLALSPGQGATFEKLISVYTSRDTDAPVLAALAKLAEATGYADLLAVHETAWADVWSASDVIVDGDPTAQIALRHGLFQTLIAAPRHDDRVSMSAKTLSGFGYRGHVFWDTEIFCLPFLTYTQPELARNLLTYRYHTLPGARRKARANGYEGAMYAWESALTGDEVTPRWVPGPHGKELVRIWCGDIELHITVDVAYAAWHYWRATGDDEWMERYGAEIILDTAVFWGSRAEWNAALDRYEIRDVIGPDENHEHVDNNAFTNRLVAWHLEIALQVHDWLRETSSIRASALTAQLDLSPERRAAWRHICNHMLVLFDPHSGLIEQFEGFFGLQDVDLADYEPRRTSMQAIFGIEQANQYQVLKQADVLMLLYLLRGHYDRRTIETNWDYYAPRTDHTYGSSLGPAIHAIIASLLDRPEAAYEHFMRAAWVDLEDVRGNAADGIHAASAGGLWQAVVFGFGGIHLTSAGPVSSPRLPAKWTRLRFRLFHQGRWVDFDLRPPTGQLDIRGIIFDLDGVLTDTSEYHYLGWKRLADEEGIPFDRAANEALRGVSRQESMTRLLNGRPITEEKRQEMMARKNRYYKQYIQGVTQDNLLPGALTLLKSLKAAGIKVAIGSASKNAQTLIDNLDIAGFIDTISDGFCLERQKPSPDLFLHAAAQLGLQAPQCIVVENADPGVQAARAGGMWTVGLGPEERVGSAHVVRANLEGLNWTGLLALLRQAVQRNGTS